MSSDLQETDVYSCINEYCWKSGISKQVNLSLSLSIYISIYLSIYLSIYRVYARVSRTSQILRPPSHHYSDLPFQVRKPKRIRTAFSPSQLLRLEHAFEKNHYVVGQERKDLAASLNLTETQVRNWINLIMGQVIGQFG